MWSNRPQRSGLGSGTASRSVGTANRGHSNGSVSDGTTQFHTPEAGLPIAKARLSGPYVYSFPSGIVFSRSMSITRYGAEKYGSVVPPPPGSHIGITDVSCSVVRRVGLPGSLCAE